MLGPLQYLNGWKEALAVQDMPPTYPLPVCRLCEETVDPIEKVECSVRPVHTGLYVMPVNHHEESPQLCTNDHLQIQGLGCNMLQLSRTVIAWGFWHRAEGEAGYSPKQEDIVACQVVDVLASLQHHKLRKDGHSFQVD